MKRMVSCVLIACAFPALAATAVAAKPPIFIPKADPYYSKPPIVSPKADPYYRYGGLKGTKGFGPVKPREIYYGGDETSVVCNIHWKSWGGSVARGTGIGFYLGPNQFTYQAHFTHVIVAASKLGTWKGRPAYNKLSWSSPSHGRDRASC